MGRCKFPDRNYSYIRLSGGSGFNHIVYSTSLRVNILSCFCNDAIDVSIPSACWVSNISRFHRMILFVILVDRSVLKKARTYQKSMYCLICPTRSLTPTSAGRYLNM